MTTPTNAGSTASKAPAPTQTNLRRRPIRAATELIAKSAANIMDVPGLKDSIQAARGIVMALKPDILQEPARNDIVAQNLIDYLDEILLCAHNNDAEETYSEYLNDLQQIKAAIVVLKNKNYQTKLACQRDIGRELVRRKDETFERALLFSVSVMNAVALMDCIAPGIKLMDITRSRAAYTEGEPMFGQQNSKSNVNIFLNLLLYSGGS